MKISLIVSVLLVSQIMFASGAFAQSGDASNKDSTAKQIQALEDKSNAYQDKVDGDLIYGGGALTVGALLHGARVMTMRGNVFGLIYDDPMTLNDFKKLIPGGYEIEKGLYGIGLAILGKGLYDYHKESVYAARAVSLSSSKTLPADEISGSGPVPSNGAVVTGAK